MKMNLKIEWKRKTGKYQLGWWCEVGDGVIVGELHQPSQTRDYAGPRWRADTSLPGIRVRQGLLHETEDQAKALLEQVVRQWFQRCGAVL